MNNSARPLKWQLGSFWFLSLRCPPPLPTALPLVLILMKMLKLACPNIYVYVYLYIQGYITNPLLKLPHRARPDFTVETIPSTRVKIISSNHTHTHTPKKKHCERNHRLISSSICQGFSPSRQISNVQWIAYCHTYRPFSSCLCFFFFSFPTYFVNLYIHKT